MFDRITLGVCGDTNFFRSRLYNHPECMFPVTIKKDRDKQTLTYIDFEATDDVCLLHKYVEVVAEYIIDRYEKRLLKQILDEEYPTLSPVGRRDVLKNTELFTDHKDFGYYPRKQSVVLSIYDYLKEDTTMLVDGFVAFRLKEYEKLLKALAEALVENYMTRREYEDFIALLRYFVSVQNPRPEVLHIVVAEEGGYTLLDEEQQDITAESFADFIEGEFLLSEEDYDDLLLSVLITRAPKNIVVHNEKAIQNKELFTTIGKVFKGKVTTCPLCPLCNKE